MPRKRDRELERKLKKNNILFQRICLPININNSIEYCKSNDVICKRNASSNPCDKIQLILEKAKKIISTFAANVQKQLPSSAIRKTKKRNKKTPINNSFDWNYGIFLYRLDQFRPTYKWTDWTNTEKWAHAYFVAFF